MAMEDELNEMLALGPVNNEGDDDAQNTEEENLVEDPELEEEATEEVEVGETEESESDVGEAEDEFDDSPGGDPRDSVDDDDYVEEDEDGDESEIEEGDDSGGDSAEVAGLKAQVAQLQAMMQQVFVGGALPGVQDQQVNQQVAPQTTKTTDQEAELDPQKLMEGVDFEQVFVDPSAFAGVLLNVVKAAQSGASQQATQAVAAAQKQQEQKAAVNNFWQQNPDLVNFRTQLAAVTQNIGATNPNLKSTDEVLEAAGDTVRALYGLKPKAGKAKTTTTKGRGKGKAGVKRSLKSPAKARKQGGSRRKKVSKKNKTTGMQAEIDAMLNLET
jgi:hypothetical protein